MFSKVIAASAILTGADALRFDLGNLFGNSSDDDDSDDDSDNAVFSQLVDSIEGQLVEVNATTGGFTSARQVCRHIDFYFDGFKWAVQCSIH